MKKKIISALVLIGLLVTPMAAYADAAVGDQIVTIGTNLTQQQRQEVLSYFGAKDNAQIIDVDISEERQYLSGKVPDAQIGNSTNSCAMITYTTKGSGVNVTTHNINYVTRTLIRAPSSPPASTTPTYRSLHRSKSAAPAPSPVS